MIRNGVPFDIAFQLPDVERAAFCIIFSEHEGARFNWTSWTLEEPR